MRDAAAGDGEAIVREHGECLQELDAAICDEAKTVRDVYMDADPRTAADAYTLLRCLSRALAIPECARACADGTAEPQSLVANRTHIHDVLGAPGDWGYGTRLGQALQRLYAIDYGPLLAGASEPS